VGENPAISREESYERSAKWSNVRDGPLRMNSRERVISALEFSGPDRVPIMHRTLPGAFYRYGRQLEELYARYPGDVLLSPTWKSPFRFGDPTRGFAAVGDITDAWGCLWRRTTRDWDGAVIRSPIEDWSAFQNYQLPSATDDKGGVQEMVDVTKADHHQHYVMVEVEPLMHRITWLRGFENSMIDIAEGREELYRLRDLIVDFILEQIAYWLEHKEVDGFLLGDDWGSQNGLFIAPHAWREIFKPSYQKIVAAVHSSGRYIHFHTDGNTTAIIPDLVEIGFDELNPQVSCIDLVAVGHQYAGRVCFRPDLDRQRTLPFGSPEDVSKHVREVYQALAKPDGGFIGYGQIGPDVPLANATAMLQTFQDLR
jgi:uroporphyrinogen decarboxylase